MAIFHLSAKVVSRGKGQSAVAKAAYNSREKIEQELTGVVNDYSRKGGLMFSGIFAPKDAPEWAHDRAKLWNEVERRENRKDAQLAREVEIALPHELTDEQRRQLVTDFVREQFQRKGMVADVNIHAPDRQGDDRNYHAHILLTMRSIGPEGFGDKVREWNSREQLDKWREGWERTANRYLERHGHEVQIDRRTLEAQGIDREPTEHRGVHAQGMERKGVETERGNAYRDTFERNQNVAELKSQLRAVDREIEEERQQRAVQSPDGGGLVEHQGWAMEQVKEAHEERRRKQDERARTETQTGLDKEPEIDVARFRTDKSYRQEIMTREAQKMAEERRGNRERGDQRQERDERQR
jgi:ATP-dependent exoDNAse (exonuclease V) alpha subunit